MMWSVDGVEGHQQVVDDHRNAVGREEEHHEDLEPSGVTELHQELVDGRRGRARARPQRQLGP